MYVSAGGEVRRLVVPDIPLEDEESGEVLFVVVREGQ